MMTIFIRKTILGFYLLAFSTMMLSRDVKPATGSGAFDDSLISRDVAPRLIVHSDDMGAFHSVNVACIEAFKNGIETDIELMVVTPWFTNTLTSSRVKQVINERGIELINYIDVAGALPRSAPEAENVASEGIARYLEAVESKGQELHSLMIVRHGKVVFERWFGDHAANKPHQMWSVSKTFTSTAIGFAVSENRLKVTDKVISFFPDKLPTEVSPYLRQMEIRHLLTMSTGNEERQINRNGANVDWVEAFLAAPMVRRPGAEFSYNSMATYMLSAILQKVTGEKLVDYLYPRLFRPLGITGVTWSESPQGINIGGWGLSVKTEDMAKLGQFILQKGRWNDAQLLPEAWIVEATTSHIASLPSGTTRENLTMKPEDSDWLQGYGYKIWRCRHNGFRADGANGQFIIMLPDQDAVIVVTANISDMQSELNLIWEHLLPAMK